MEKKFIQNAYKNVSFEAEFRTPGHEDQVKEIVKEAYERGKKVKVIGGKHSFNHIFHTNDILVDLKGLKTIEVNVPNREVKVGAGVTIFEAIKECDKHRLHFPSLGSYHAQTIPGVIATSTHGSSLGYGSLSDIVEEVEIVNSDGDTVNYSKETDELKALRCHLGQLGILTSVKLKLVPAFSLHCEISSQSAPKAFKQILKTARKSDYVSMLWIPDTDTACTRVLTSRPLHAGFSRNRAATDLERFFVNKSTIRHRLYDFGVFVGGHIYLSKRLGSLKTLHSRFRQRYCSATEKEFCIDKDIIDKSYRVFLYDHYREPTENHRLRMIMNVEYAFDVSKLEELLKELRFELRRFRDNGQYLNYPRVQVRFAKGSDKTLIGLNAGRDTAYVGIYVVASIKHKSQIPIGETVENIFIRHGGRPHWGKYSYIWRKNSYLAGPAVDSDYGDNYKKFQDVRSRLDRHKMFLSPKDMFDGLELFDKPPPIGAMVWSVFDPNEYPPIQPLK